MVEVYLEMDSTLHQKTSAQSDSVISPEESSSKMSCSDSNANSLKEQFAEETTLHGVGYWLSQERCCYQRFFFFIHWLVMLGAAVGFIFLNIQSYHRYETKVSMSREKVDSMAFPSVTICPESNFKQSLIGGSRFMLAILDKMRPDASMDSCFNQSLPDNFPEWQTTMTFWTANGNRDGSDKLMIPFKELFLECSFQLKKIPCEELFVGHWTTMARCFTFNHLTQYNSTRDSFFWQYAKNVKRNVHVSGSGLQNRLQVRLNVNLNETCDHWTTDHTGFRLIVNDRASLPYFVDKSILLAPGFRTQVSVEEIRLDRNKTESLGRCRGHKELFLFSNVEYTRDNCIIQCLSEEVYKKCECLFAFLPMDKNFIHDQLVKHHGNLNVSGDPDMCFGNSGQDCMNAIYQPFLQGKGNQHCYKQCPFECFRKEYQVQMSFGTFPPKKMIPQLQNQTGLKTVDEIKDNVLEVDIFMKSMEVMIIEEAWAMTPVELFSNLGGNLGLFLGASIFSFVELFNFLVSAIFVSRQQRRNHLQVAVK